MCSAMLEVISSFRSLRAVVSLCDFTYYDGAGDIDTICTAVCQNRRDCSTSCMMCRLKVMYYSSYLIN